MTSHPTAIKVVSRCPFRGGVLQLVQQKALTAPYGAALEPGTYGVRWEGEHREVQVDSLEALADAIVQQPADGGPAGPEESLELARIFADLLCAGRVVDDAEMAHSAAPALATQVRCPFVQDNALNFVTTRGQIGEALEFVQWQVDLAGLSHQATSLGMAR